jgi:ribosome-associated protein
MTETIETGSREKLNVILEALKEKKAKQIVTIDLQKVGTAICDYFVICHGDSTTQVSALSDAVIRKMKKELHTGAHHVEGTNNSLWVLLDYSDIVVHVFLNEKRDFYRLEELWADGKMEKIEDVT